MGLDERARQWLERADTTANDAAEATVGTLRRMSAGWRLEIGGQAVDVPHSRGMAHLAVLLGHPGQPVAAEDLAGWTAAASAQAVLDPAARRSYRRRLADLDETLADAEACADLGRADLARTERAALLDEIARHTGLGGRSRAFTDSRERARTAVQKALRRAVDAVAAADQELGSRLRGAVVTGTECFYQAGPGLPRTWKVTDQP
ncbi:hypothetical protein [Fodinicola feengrottensis]|nr:hypothetical protein [Fodinicola feengrottensis]